MEAGIYDVSGAFKGCGVSRARKSKMEEKREAAYILADKGFQLAEISEIVRIKIDTVHQWLESRLIMAK